MADDLELNIRKAVEGTAKALADAAELTVETHFVEVGAAGASPSTGLVAKTIIQLDGDHNSTIPMQRTEGGQLVVDQELFDLHARNVSTAIEYRVNMLNTLLGLIRIRRA